MSKTAFYYLTGQIEGIEKAKDSLNLYFKGKDVDEKLRGDLYDTLEEVKKRLREERDEMMEDDFFDDDDDDD
ncbi:MAG: hypothetical protein IJH86_04625, partial [Clostridia bacterium]|nr:hypothetical protein [Clostridia bacterium]